MGCHGRPDSGGRTGSRRLAGRDAEFGFRCEAADPRLRETTGGAAARGGSVRALGGAGGQGGAMRPAQMRPRVRYTENYWKSIRNPLSRHLVVGSPILLLKTE